MKLLCIETVACATANCKVIKNEIYEPVSSISIGLALNGIDKWWILKGFPSTVHAHVSLFIELPEPDPIEETVDVEFELVNQ
jgi:hypothetical protein